MISPTAYRFRHIAADGETVLWESDWIENALADEGEEHILNCYFSQSGTLPAGFYLGLVNDTPVETDTLATLQNEPSGNGYARQATTFGNAAADAGDYQTVASTETFTASGGTIGPVTYLFLTDAASGTSGLLIAYVALSTTRTLADGESLQVDLTAKLS